MLHISTSICFINRNRDKGLEMWLRKYSACLAHVRPWVQSPLLHKPGMHCRAGLLLASRWQKQRQEDQRFKVVFIYISLRPAWNMRPCL